MTSIDSLDQLPTGTWLRDNPVAAHLGSDEAVEHVLTNREVGLRREADDGPETQRPPADDCGAVAVLTDRRILFLVGDPPSRQGDLVESVAYERVVEAVAETETLTQRVLVETDGERFAFTARETDAVDEVQSFLETAAGVYAGCEDHLADAEDARDRLAAAVDEADWAACGDAINDARIALGEARALLEGTPFAPLRERVSSVRDEIDDLACVRHRRQAEALADECERLLEDHEYERGHERLQAARDHLETAETLVGDQAAAADGGTDAAGATVATTQDRIDTLASTITTRPVADAEAYYRTADDADDRDERIDALETAFDCYRSAATLLADEQSPFEGDERAARDDAERVIADLIDAHLGAARDEHAAGEWERDADNPESAYELLCDAATHGERALELAQAYPPGDVATIEEVLADVETLIDPLRIEVELSEAGE